MNTHELKKRILEGRLDEALSGLGRNGSALTVESRNALAGACQEIADQHGFGKAVELVIALSRKLGFLLADPEVDTLETVEVPLPGGAVGRLEENPKRADRGNVQKLTERGIINPGAPEDSWMYERWPADRMGGPAPLDDAQRGWGRKQFGAVKCFLCSGLGRGRERPVNPNEIFISFAGPDGTIHAGCNFAALAPYHMTAFLSDSTQQRVDGLTVERALSILENLHKGSDPTKTPFSVIHNGDLVCSVDKDGKVAMKGAGATLLHDHNQFMRADLPVANAKALCRKTANGVELAVLDWPSSAICVSAPPSSRKAFLQQANRVIRKWQEKKPGNTVNLILTTDGQDNLVAFIAMRRVGMADAPGKKCVASLEQSGIIVLDDLDVFRNCQSASAADRLGYLTTVLQAVDPVLADAGGDAGKKQAILKELVGV